MAAQMLLKNMAVGSLKSLLAVRAFECLPVDLSRHGCSKFVARWSRVWYPLFLLASRLLSARSESDQMSRYDLFPHWSVNKSAFCTGSSNEIDW